MKINVHAGHTRQSGKAPGASGKFHESVEDRKIARQLIKILKKRGHTVYNCTSNGSSARDNLRRIVAKCNRHKVDLDVSIHFNCFNGQGKGTEAWIYPGNRRTKKYATEIEKLLSSRFGWINRGVKSSSSLYVLNHTNADAVLIEVCFCDNAGDAKKYKKAGAAKVARAIADAIDLAKVR